MALITGTTGHDHLNGTSGDDVIEGLDGNDRLDGGAGNDVVRGGAGRDIIDDYDGGDDQLYGEDGDDYLSAGPGSGGSRNVLADGGAGDDYVFVSMYDVDGKAEIFGGDGHDEIQAQYAGYDTFVTIDGGAGNDFVTAIRDEGYTPDYVIALGAGADLLRGVAGSSNGAVTLTDFAPGDGGDALLLVRDLVYELTGWDRATNPFASGHMRLVGSGPDTLLQIDRDGAAGGASFITYATFRNVAAADLTARNLGGYAADGSAAPGQTIAGTAEPDRLSGTMGADTMTGGEGDDHLFGAAGDDLIEGGDGGDYLDGDLGDDVISGEGGDDYVHAGQDGDDQLFGGDGYDQLYVTRLLAGPGSTSLMDGGAGHNRLNFSASVPGHRAAMRGGDDVDDFDVRGVGLSAEIDGGAGNDRLWIDPDDDNVYDISLGAGSDTVSLYSATFGSTPRVFDIAISDFEVGAGGDKIVLTNLLTYYAHGWNAAIDPFAAGYLRLVQSGADTILQIDRTGSALGQAFVNLVRFGNADRQTFTADNFNGHQPNLGNQAPDFTMNATPLSYRESVNAEPSAELVDVSLTLTDADDLHLVSVTVAITGGFQPGEDQLGFAHTVPSDYYGDITGSYDEATGVLTLTSASGTATLRQWDNAAGSVFYRNLSNEPNGATRTVSFTAFDGQATSAVAVRDILVTARNDPPGGTDSRQAVDEDGAFTFAAAHFGFTDGDGDAFSGVRISSAPTGGKIYFDSDGAGGAAPVEVTVFPSAIYSAADIAAGKLSFVSTANLQGIGAATVRFRVLDDGGVQSGGQNIDPVANVLTFDIAGTNDAPSLVVAGGAVAEHSALGTVVATASASDPESAASSLVFSLDDDAGGRFAIDPVTGAIRVADPAAIDFESAASHDVAIRVTDPGGAIATLVKTILLADAAEALTGGAGADHLSAFTDEDWSVDGAGGDDALGGRAGADRLDGGSGADAMAGGGGDDVYRVDDSGDTVTELAGGGTDTVESAIDYVLPAEVEQLLLGAGAVSGSGNGLVNRVVGNAAANILNGGGAADRMEGGAGDDLYFVDLAADELVELSGEGTDTVRASASYTLADHVEHLVLTGGGNNHGTGNGLANTITGNNGNNRLDGKAGADTMAGGAGHDTYVVNSALDQVIEAGSSGTDTVESAVGFRLPTHFEKLILTGNLGYDGTGNAGANTITGNAGGNFLNGGRGNDIIDGGAGSDRLMGSLGNDRLTGGGGDDRFYFNVAPGGANADDILDFSAAGDAVYLLRSVFTRAGANGTLSPSAFHQGANAADAGDRILYDAATGNIFYDADGSGAAAALLVATVDPGTSLTHADFLIYG